MCYGYWAGGDGCGIDICGVGMVQICVNILLYLDVELLSGGWRRGDMVMDVVWLFRLSRW